MRKSHLVRKSYLVRKNHLVRIGGNLIRDCPNEGGRRRRRKVGGAAREVVEKWRIITC